MDALLERRSAVTYIGLPVSSGGSHHLGRISLRDAYLRTLAFLETCTQLVEPVKYELDVLNVPELPPNPTLERQVERTFGQSLRKLAQSRKQIAIADDRVNDVLDFLESIDPQPTNRWGMASVWFWTGAKFRILDPATTLPLPGQDPGRFGGVEYEYGVPLGSNRLRLILSKGASISIELCIPDADDQVLNRVIPWLEQRLPFRFSPKHWRVWTPTKSGSFKARLFDPRDIYRR